MDLRQLRSAVTIAEEGQFSRAAERLGIAQPSLSAQIARLERELGLVLFARTTRRLQPTEAGELLVTRARSVLADIDQITAELERLGGLLTGRIMIGLTQTPGPLDVVALLGDFHRRHPSVHLAVREDLSLELAAQLRDDVLDLGILTMLEPADRRGLEMIELAAERLVLVVGHDHPIATRSSVTIRDLRDEPLVASPPGATIRDLVIRTARAAGFAPDIAFESREVSRIRALVAAGLGVAVLPRSDAVSPGPTVRVVEFEEAALSHRIVLCWRERRRLSPAAQALIERSRALRDAAQGR